MMRDIILQGTQSEQVVLFLVLVYGVCHGVYYTYAKTVATIIGASFKSDNLTRCCQFFWWIGIFFLIFQWS